MREVRLGLMLCALILPGVASATLGEGEGSVLRYDERSAVTRQVTPKVTYAIHEGITNAGVRVREYTNSQGIVFAVTWSGPSIPNMAQLLGGYAQRLQQNRTPGTHHLLSIQADDFSFSNLKLPRGFVGRAVLRRALPEGVLEESLQ